GTASAHGNLGQHGTRESPDGRCDVQAGDCRGAQGGTIGGLALVSVGPEQLSGSAGGGRAAGAAAPDPPGQRVRPPHRRPPAPLTPPLPIPFDARNCLWFSLWMFLSLLPQTP